MVGEHCPHRLASLAYGRVDDEGIRCPYHGWKFDRTGKCLEQPANPASNIQRPDQTSFLHGRATWRIDLRLTSVRSPGLCYRVGMCLSGKTAGAGSSRTRSSIVIGCSRWENSVDPALVLAAWGYGSPWPACKEVCRAACADSFRLNLASINGAPACRLGRGRGSHGGRAPAAVSDDIAPRSVY